MARYRVVLLNGLKAFDLWKLWRDLGDNFAIQCSLVRDIADRLGRCIGKKECSIAIEVGLISFLKDRNADIGIDLSLLEKIADAFIDYDPEPGDDLYIFEETLDNEIKIFRCFAAAGVWLA